MMVLARKKTKNIATQSRCRVQQAVPNTTGAAAAAAVLKLPHVSYYIMFIPAGQAEKYDAPENSSKYMDSADYRSTSKNKQNPPNAYDSQLMTCGMSIFFLDQRKEDDGLQSVHKVPSTNDYVLMIINSLRVQV